MTIIEALTIADQAKRGTPDFPSKSLHDAWVAALREACGVLAEAYRGVTLSVLCHDSLDKSEADNHRLAK